LDTVEGNDSQSAMLSFEYIFYEDLTFMSQLQHLLPPMKMIIARKKSICSPIAAGKQYNG
jgi:hypothetical protein